MYPIVEARFLAPDVKLFRIEAPRVARKRRAGHFVFVRVHQAGKRIPAAIADSSPAEGIVTLIVEGDGKAAQGLNRLGTGDVLLDLIGPLGRPTEVQRFGTVAVVCREVGAALAYPCALALRQAGNRVISILGARTFERLILEEETYAASDLLIVATDDGSHGLHGDVTRALGDRIAAEPIDRVYAIGPAPMTRAVAEVTRPQGIPTIVSPDPWQ